MRKVIIKLKTTAGAAEDMLHALESRLKHIIGTSAGSLNIVYNPTKISHGGKKLSFTLTALTKLSPSMSTAVELAVVEFREMLGRYTILRQTSKDLSYTFEIEETSKSFESVMGATQSLILRMKSNTKVLDELTADRLLRVKNIEHFEKLIAEATSSQKALFSYLRQL